MHSSLYWYYLIRCLMHLFKAKDFGVSIYFLLSSWVQKVLKQEHWKKKLSKKTFLEKTYRKKSEIWPRRTLGRNWEHWTDICNIGQILRTLSRHKGHWAEIGDIGQTLGRHWADNGHTLGRHWADIGQTLGRHWADIELILGRHWHPPYFS